MKLYDDGDFTALNWVKQALDATLALAREALEIHVEDPDNREPMRACSDHLHQVQGTLRMVELYGAAMVVENMERVAEALVGDSIRQREEAYSVLMRGLVQLPDYLERLQSGHKDIPIVLLPLLNDLRACRGESLLSESALFAPDLDVALPGAAVGSAQPLPIADLRSQALRLRLGFQAALLKWIRDEGAAKHLRRLIDVLDRLRAISYGEEARRLWWVAAGVIDAVESGDLEASVSVKLLFGRVDREIHRFAATGEAGIASSPPRELVKNLLYYIAHSGESGAQLHGQRSAQIRETYRLDTLLPTAGELQHAQGSMTGRNRNLLGTVSAAIKDDLVRVKEALDIFLRSHNSDASELAGQVEILDRVGDTLGMLGLGVPRRVVGEQREVIEDMAHQRRPIDEGALLDVAGALLYVEASLDDHIERLGAAPEVDDGADPGLPKAEVRKILDALMHEAAINIQQAKQDVIAFIESPWDHARLLQIPRLLEEIAGALRMLGLVDAAESMTAVVRFVEVELVEHQRVPTTEQMDKLADALAAIEYYLEATREQRRNRDRILEVARDSLEGLGYWPLPTVSAQELAARAGAVADVDGSGLVDPGNAGTDGSAADAIGSIDFPPLAVDEVAADIVAAEEPTISLRKSDLALEIGEALDFGLPSIDILPGESLDDLVIGNSDVVEPAPQDLSGLRLAQTGAGDESAGWTEIEEEVEEEIPADEQAPGGFEGVTGEEIDDDIREVFVEEVEEELQNLRRQVPAWKSDVENLEQLTVVRRSFHTLKGSGRLVGAVSLGEFSWKVEGLLNRVLDRSIAPGPAVVALVDHAVDAIPALLGALRGETGGSANIAGIMDTADRLAVGEEAWLPTGDSSKRLVRRSVRRRVRSRASDLPSFDADIRTTANLVRDEDFGEAPSSVPTQELVAGPLPNIDPVLFDILQSEVAAHLGIIDEYLATCEPTAIPASKSLLRAAHTLNGAIAMVDIPTIGNVLAPLEHYIKRLRAAEAAPTAEGIVAIGDIVQLTREVMRCLEARDENLPDSIALASRVAALRDSLPEPSGSVAWYSDVEGTPDSHDSMTDDVDQTVMHGSVPEEATGTADVTGEWLAGSGDRSEEIDALNYTSIPEELADSLADFDKSSARSIHDDDVHAVEHDTAFEAMFGRPSVADQSPADESITADGHTERDIETLDGDRAAADDTAVELDIEDLQAPPPVPEEPSIPAPAEFETSSDGTVGATDGGVAESGSDTIGEDASANVIGRISRSPDDAVYAIGVDEAGRAAADSSRTLIGAEAPPIEDDPQPDGPLDAADADDDLLDIFAQEGADILDHADALVVALREPAHERDAMVGLQRDLHTLKGGARMAGLAPIGDLSHAMESLVDAVSDGRLAVDRLAVESLELGFDRLHDLVQRVAQRRAIAMPLHAIARFERLVAGEDIATRMHPEAASAAPSVPGAEEATSTAAAAPPVQRPAPRHLTAMDQEEVPHAPQEMIRVRSDLLDSLVNYAGEVSIYRSRLEQQISTFRFNLVEFDQTVTRLREQLRKLEIETEAQIIARYQREQQDTGLGAFDPLELDRFSQLQQLSRALGESVSDLVSIQGLLDDQTRQSETLLLQQSRVSSDLQEGLMRTRMVPFDSLVPNLRRTLRQAAQELGKRAQLRVDGAHGEMDRNLLERMKAPFEHMLRNALAHGIESPAEREAAGKPAEGTVNIAVSRESTEVVLRVSDDGRGMDREAIRAQAIERGLLKPEVNLPDRDLWGFVLESGFSTARELTQLSGRGVGMDVVHNEIKQLGGSLVIDSVAGERTVFTIRLPFTLAVTQAILVRLGDSSYAIPMSSVQGVARIAHEDLEKRLAEGNPKHAYAGEEYTIYDLAQLLGVQRARVASEDSQVPLLMTRTGDQRAAVRIDEVIGSREIVVKSVGPQVSSVPGIFGATIMGDGSVVIILDLAPLVRRLAALQARIEAGTEVAPASFTPLPEPQVEVRQRPLVMVVDDSITMRKVTTRVLERADFDVQTAKDGLDALEKLQDVTPDLMLLDIEMPRMDGYELATYMRNDTRLRQVPIIMITSRTGEKHRQRALEIGVERYLGKPYQEDDLLKQVHEVLRRERV